MKPRGLTAPALVGLLAACAGERPAPAPTPTPTLRSAFDLLWLCDVSDPSRLDASLRASFDSLRASRVPTVDDAIGVATRYALASGGLRAEESIDVVGLLPLGVDVPDFAPAGDLVWVARVAQITRGVNQELWISASTGEVLAMLSGAGDDEPPEPWCLAGRALLPTLPGPVRRPLSGVAVTVAPLAVAENAYRDVLPPEGDAPAVEPRWDTFADGSTLVWVAGTGPWYENTALLLQLQLDARPCRLLSCHLYWSGDTPPIAAWCAIGGGSLTLDCSGEDERRLAVAFDLRASEGSEGHAASIAGAFRVDFTRPSGGIPAFAVAQLAQAAAR